MMSKCWHCNSKCHDTGECPGVFSDDAKERRKEFQETYLLRLFEKFVRECKREGYVLRSLEFEENDMIKMSHSGVELTLPKSLANKFSDKHEE